MQHCALADRPVSTNCQRRLVEVGRLSDVYLKIIYVGLMKSNSELLADVVVFISTSCLADFFQVVHQQWEHIHWNLSNRRVVSSTKSRHNTPQLGK